MSAVLLFCAHVGSGYLLAVVGGVLHTQQVGVRPSVQVTVLSADVSVPSIAWPALAAEQGLGVDTQVDAVCMFVTVMATVFAWVSGRANLKQII